MAEKRKPLGILARTEPEEQPTEQAPLRTGKPGRKKKRNYAPDETAPLGVGVTQAEGERLTEIAAALGVNRHSLLVWIVRDFIRRYDEGYRPPTGTKTITVLKQE